MIRPCSYASDVSRVAPMPISRRKHRRAAEVDRVRQEVAAAGSIAGAELEVGTDHQRQRSKSLHRVQFFRGLDRRTDRHDEAADVVSRSVARARVQPVLDVGVKSPKTMRPHELRRFVARRQRGEDRIRPAR